MSVVAQEVTDAKAGFSTMCRRGDHVSCASAQARCTCTCHGSRPQGPESRDARPRVVVDRKPRIVEAMTGFQTDDDPPKPSASSAPFACPECGRDDFRSAGALGTHRTRKHKPRKPDTTFVYTPEPEAAPTGRHLVVVDTPEPVVRAFACLEDAEAAIELVRHVGISAWRLDPEVGKP